MPRKKLTNEQEINICKQYKNGLSSIELAEEFNLHSSTIRAIVSRNGGKIRSISEANCSLTIKEEEEIAIKYSSGIPSTVLAKEYDVSVATILFSIKRRNIEIMSMSDRNILLPDKKEIEIKNSYENGLEINELEKKFNVHIWTIRRILEKHGVRLRPRPRKFNPSIEEKNDIVVKYINRFSMRKLAEEYNTWLGRIRDVLIENGVNIRTDDMTGENNSSWKGGRKISKHGYVHVWLSENDEFVAMKDANGYVLEHRLIMAKNLRRILEKYETVHHINGNRQDNRIENLQLRKGNHGQGQVNCCLDCGSHNILSVIKEGKFKSGYISSCIDCNSILIGFEKI